MRSKHLKIVTKFARILNLRVLDLLPCTCKIPGQDHFWGVKFLFMGRFSKFLWHFLPLLECKRMMISYLYVGFLELQQGDKKVVSKGWCKESRNISMNILMKFHQ